MQFRPFIKLMLTLILGAFFTIGCSKATDEDKVGDAQFCLDDMPITGLSAGERTSYVNNCLSKMDGVTTKQAQLIRCSSGFLIEGFSDPSTLANILKSFKNNQQNSSTALLGVLAFKSKGNSLTSSSNEDKVFAQETFNYCNSAGNPGYVLISSIANMATVISSISSNGSIEQGIADLLTNQDALASTSAEVIGATAIVAHQTSCQTIDDSNRQVCTELGNAIASGASPEQIGSALLSGWNNQNP